MVSSMRRPNRNRDRDQDGDVVGIVLDGIGLHWTVLVLVLTEPTTLINGALHATSEAAAAGETAACTCACHVGTLHTAQHARIIKTQAAAHAWPGFVA
jgi:hypothetical protein